MFLRIPNWALFCQCVERRLVKEIKYIITVIISQFYFMSKYSKRIKWQIIDWNDKHCEKQIYTIDRRIEKLAYFNIKINVCDVENPSAIYSGFARHTNSHQLPLSYMWSSPDCLSYPPGSVLMPPHASGQFVFIWIGS